MPIFSHPEFDAHEKVLFGHDAESGLKAIIAIHNTNRGPALGGCRMWAYDSDEAALEDVLRLSKGMSYKSALAGLPFGGGKSVIIGDARTMKSELLFTAMGRLVESLGGRYIVAEDVGVSVADVEIMGRETDHVAGLAGASGDPSPATAYGVYMGIRAAVEQRLGRQDLKGLSIAVQGVGSVGYYLCRYLKADGAKLIITDIADAAVARVVQEFGAESVPPDAIYEVAADVYAPCALGATVNDDTIDQLKVAIVAGSANNQLDRPDHAEALAQRNILYAPDYVINAGGVINIAHERKGYDKRKAVAQVADIKKTLHEIFERASRDGITTAEAADRLAEERIAKPDLTGSVAA